MNYPKFTNFVPRSRTHRSLGRSYIALTLLASVHIAFAQSAIWDLNPATNDWSTAANWTPQAVPTDVATFAASNVTDVAVSWPGVSVNQITFSPGASAYSIGGFYILFLSGGVSNNSGVTQNITLSEDWTFAGNATAGDNVIYTVQRQNPPGDPTFFDNNSDGGTATFLIKGDSATNGVGFLWFTDESSAASCTMTDETGDTQGGVTYFSDRSTASKSNITVETGAALLFQDDATGDSAILAADGGTIYFEEQSNGQRARLQLVNGGFLDLSTHNTRSPMSIGSLEGDSISTVRLGSQQLTIGGNGLSTIFGGLISQNGSLTKIGPETLTLTHANNYKGGTTISGGTLIAQTRTGSATGTGAVKVNAGTLGGKGTMSGAVTIGTGTGSGASLAPGVKGPDTLTFSKTLTFKADGTYKCDLSLAQPKADQVNANGVTIENGAQFVLHPKGFQTLTVGTVFTVINNTAATPISGTFANLADGSIISATAGNKLQVSYEGGSGNDLILTVVP